MNTLPECLINSPQLEEVRQKILRCNGDLHEQSEIPELHEMVHHFVHYCNCMLAISADVMAQLKHITTPRTFGLQSYTPKKMLATQVNSTFIFIHKLSEIAQRIVEELNALNALKIGRAHV